MIEASLLEVEKKWEASTFKVIPGVDEDIHTVNERRLSETMGKDVADKLQTGRIRNEQIATGMHLWLRDELNKLEAHLKSFLSVIANRAETEVD